MTARFSQRLLVAMLALLLAGPSAAQSALSNSKTMARQTDPADSILLNGNIVTPAGSVSSLAIRDGVIVGVGDQRDLRPFIGPNTKTMELGGATVLPGIHDMHVHPYFAGLEQFACGFAPAAPPDDILKAVADCVAEESPGEWIEGGNWVAAVFEPGEQTRQLLDTVAPNNPVMLSDEAHHSVWVNTRALELAGITRETPDPDGGIIERDANGEPTGLLRETAVDLVVAVLPLPTRDERRRALELASNIMLSYGITSLTVASVRENEIGDFADLSEEGVIKQRVRGCIVWSPTPDELRRSTEALIAMRERYNRPRFRTDCVKMFLDGVPTESQTAAMLEPYVEDEGGAHDESHGSARPEKGIMMVPRDQLNDIVTDLDRQGLHIKFHVVGDAAVRAAIDAVEIARQRNGWGGPRHDLGHNSFVDPADIPRARDLHIAWEFSPYIWYPTPIAADDIARVVGEERMERWIPIKDAVDSGALVVVGSDWSVVPSVNPWLAIETLVTREKPGGSKETLGRGQRLTLDEAYRILTANGAQLMGHRSEVGSIEVGMRADLVVTAENLFDMPIRGIHGMTVLKTLIDGEVVYEKEAQQ